MKISSPTSINEPQPTTVAQPAPVAEQTPAIAPAQPPAEAKAFADLSRKERAIRVETKRLKAESEAFKAREASMIDRERIKAKPLEVLAELGLTPAQLAQALLDSPTPPSKEAQELAALKAEMAALREERKTEVDTSTAQALRQIRQDVDQIISRSPEFETIAATGQAGEVVNYIKAVFDKEGTILSVQEAARDVEVLLAEDEFKRFQKLSKLTKIQSRLKPQESAVETPAGEVTQEPAPSPTRQHKMPARIVSKARTVPAPGSRQVRTLNSQIQTTTRALTARERAILAFSGKLTG